MGIIKFNKTEKDKNKEAVMQTKTVGTSAEQLEAEQTALKAKEERQNNSTFDDGFLEEVVDGRNTNTLVYRRNDRTKREIISATPLHYCKDSDGKYAVIDNTLTDKG
ncbi:MAG: hypothetical protein K2N33_02480, partial [Clostridia bacterium]|nr:hypothetical protein [Clostridia bacterium]